MLSVILKRSSFAAQQVLQWTGPAWRCWTSALTRASGGGSISLQTCWASTARDDRGVKCSPVLSSRRIEYFQRTQTHAAPSFVRNQHFHSYAVRLKKRPRLPEPAEELDPLRYEMKDLWKGPKPALYLGFAGLLPFVAPTLLMAVTENYYPELAYAQLTYGASILAFVGGARWGFALPESSPAKPDWINLSNSVVPSLLACVSMMMSESIVSAGTMVILGLGIALHYDLSLLPTYPGWFKALRSVLTIVASFSLLCTLLLYGIYPEKKLFSD